ncbi:HAD family hydrolase [Archangium lansingense]|uniref:HAD family phosphatase n=1 Tax=Archangium lansingense TaxID=2995310 RepID=A0ABT4A4U5_9BACT|nr:HAD family phosphatase [Archangium lansinium]MCY1075982.1 HAD family phosphatase [Archangium lansinium]
MPKAIVFEVDGTLVDTNVLRARAWQEALARYGRQVRLPRVLAQMARMGDQFLSVFLPEEEYLRYADELASFHRALFHEEYLPRVRAFLGAPELLRHLRAEGWRIALASTADPDELEHYIELLGVEALIDARTTDAEVDRNRLHEEIPAEAVRLLGLDGTDDVLAIAGLPYDVEGAVHLGMRCVGLVCGGFSEEELRSAGALAAFGTPQDLLTRYAESPLAAVG